MASALSGVPPATAGDVARRGARNVLVMTVGRLATHAVLVVTVFVIPRLLGAECGCDEDVGDRCGRSFGPVVASE